MIKFKIFFPLISLLLLLPNCEKHEPCLCEYETVCIEDDYCNYESCECESRTRVTESRECTCSDCECSYGDCECDTCTCEDNDLEES